MITTPQYAMHAMISDLISNHHTTITEDAPVHIEFDMITNINRFESSSILNSSCLLKAVLIREILKIAFAGLIADRAIEGMIN